MALHWTYEDIEPTHKDLKQGDILYPTEELREVLTHIHPHFSAPKYLAFLVSTQCCDLVRRDGHSCKAGHISLAVIRDLETVIEKFLDRVCEGVSAGIYLQKSKGQGKELVNRILNQNEQAIGLFYLHPDETCGIAEEAVALLRVTVSLRAEEHYGILEEARRGRLRPEFRNKLGWLVGNLYSRVGTPDWADQENGDRELDELIRKFIDSPQYAWVEESWVRAAQAKDISLENLSRDEVLEVLNEHKPESFSKQIANEAKRRLEAIVSELPQSVTGIVLNEVATQLQSAGLQVNKGHLSTSLQQYLARALEGAFDSIAATVAADTVADRDCGTIDTQHLTDCLQAHLRTALQSQIEGIPTKLGNRLWNSPLLARAVDRADA